MADLARAESGTIDVLRGAPREFLVFTLAGEAYALHLTRVREILSPPPITSVPRAPRGVLGVCSVRGMLATVIDLRRRLKVDEAELSRRSRLLLVPGEDDELFGLLVDDVRYVVRLAESQVELASTVLAGEPSEYVLGVGRPDAETVLVLLDVAAVTGARKETREW